MADVRVRFAPSPTGFFHVGGARTALFNWLFARQQGGSFVLRIEDTDEERNKPEWVEGIQSAMRWIGLDWDEGPHFQSRQTDRHVEAAHAIGERGEAYWCDCARTDVDARNTAAGRATQMGYDGHCRDRSLGPGDGRVLRFRTPESGATVVRDVIRGDVEFDHANLDDFVLLRSTGKPMFVLANAIDDIDMGITHVIRGEEHLSNTPKAILLMQALGAAGAADEITWAHVPVLVNEKRQKLSKRRDKVALEDYAAEGYVADAMRNYLLLLGWAPSDDREILTVDEMVAEFRLDDVNNSPAFFDVQKLAHFNQTYLKDVYPIGRFVDEALARLAREPWADRIDADTFARFAPVLPSRVRTLGDVGPMVDFLFLDEAPVDEADWAKEVAGREHAPALLDATIDAFASDATAWTAEALHQTLLAVGEGLGLKLNKAQAPVRVAVTGRKVGPPLFESLEVLGRDATLARLRQARSRLG